MSCLSRLLLSTALLAVVTLGIAPGEARAAVVRWSLQQYVEYYDDVWVGEIVGSQVFRAEHAGQTMNHTELLIKGHSLITGRTGHQKVVFEVPLMS